MTPATGALPAVTGRRSARVVARSLFALTKPRIIELLLVTTIPTMFLADHGVAAHGSDMPAEVRQLPASINLVVEWRHVREKYKAKIDPGVAEDAFNQRISRAGTRFLARRIIGRVNPYVWVIPFARRNGNGAHPNAPANYGKEDGNLPLLAPGEIRDDNWSDHL